MNELAFVELISLIILYLPSSYIQIKYHAQITIYIYTDNLSNELLPVALRCVFVCCLQSAGQRTNNTMLNLFLTFN